MTTQEVKRKVTAILSADVKDSTALLRKMELKLSNHLTLRKRCTRYEEGRK